MSAPWICKRCGGPMFGEHDHETTAGCPALLFFPLSFPPARGFEIGSEGMSRLSRYDEAIRLLNKWLKPGQYPVTETKAFLAGEP